MHLFRLRLLALAVLLIAFATSALPAFCAGRSVYQAKWNAVIPEDSKGYQVGFSLDGGVSETPTITRGLLMRFDTSDPPTKNPFNAERNIDGRPEREIALFWNGVEVVRRFCPAELRGVAGHTVAAELRFVVGGASISLRVDKVLVYDHFLLPDVAPFPAFFVPPYAGAKLSQTTFTAWGSEPPSPAPIHIRAIDTQLVDKDHMSSVSSVNFPANTARIGRVICALTLAKTPHGFDPWDRIGEIYIVDDSGEKFELIRFMTPYRRGYQWKQDVTDLLPLLTGHKHIQIECTTYSQGWLVSVDFTFYPGPSTRHPYKVVNLWNTTAVIGQTSNPFEKQVPDRTFAIDPKADAVAVRLIATGHGEDPNSDNAAEFISLWRKLWVGNASYQNTLWKTDNYLNSCRPQSGTWKYDRAGWGPGTVVEPWLVDVTDDEPPGKPAVFRYEIQPYTNKTPNKGDPARYVIGSQVIFYRNSSQAMTH